MNLTFLGAAKTVTGSKYLLSTEKQKILIDCGLFQGLKELRSRNWNPFPINPKEIDCVILTHAHIDHSGYIPLLVKNGFTGKIYCSPATQQLCNILLIDSGYLQEEEAKFRNKHALSKHQPALPLYTKADAEKSLKYFSPIEFDTTFTLADNLTITFYRAGHILGASLVQIKQHHTTLLFSGDLGRPNDILMQPPTVIKAADYLVLESTYGDRLHPHTDPLEELNIAINRTINRGGSIIIPAFAVGRTQAMLYLLHQLKMAQKIPNIPIYLDSPMAISATNLLCQYDDEHNLKPADASKACEIATYINSVEESKALDSYQTPSIIISASGMLDGGRVLHHLKFFLSDPRNAVLLTGYQAAGTRGEALLHGKKALKIHGEMVPVNAEIIELHNLSAHADYAEILNWLENFKQAPRKVFITHGELGSATSLKNKIEEKFGWTCVVPDYLQKEDLK